ncbi:Solute carrier family 12 member 5 [Hypsibius exemplaris]|uniref:Solute carrier family 12 member 5 n=1 Tax=Hypsibius exemplaris TaxID=2072580 RepID=A0A1W0X5E5_HYPEX|nr:Solute carrier family 12 member 5 [Hypsibius exemplaris]
MMATIGAAMQSMIGAPRLLVAIAKDGVLDFLTIFSVVSPMGEPRRALLAVLVLAEVTVLIGSIDLIAPILSQFTLICYLCVNLACALQSLIKHPNWRPRFRFYHWALSLCGACLALAIMFISSWYYACIAIVFASLVYKYIDYRGAEKEWGHGWDGLALSAARYSLLRLEGQPIHTKNWRPQLLVFCRLDEDMKPIHPEIFALANQLKAGRGLCVFASILEGQFIKCAAEVQLARNSLHKYMEAENVKGFAEVLVANEAVTGMNHLIQTAGIGALKHNTVIMIWPKNWRQNTEYKNWRVFLDSLRTCHSAHHALLVPKNIGSFPRSDEKMHGTVDVWWIVHDGGLLMLLPFLLLKTKTWKHCKMRLFTIAQLEDNTIQIKKDLQSFLYGLRINAEAHVIEMGSEDISAYTYERTLVMEQRQKILKAMNLNRHGSVKKNVQLIVDQAHRKELPSGTARKTTVRINQSHTVVPPSVFRVGGGDGGVGESDDELVNNEIREPSSLDGTAAPNESSVNLSKGGDASGNHINHVTSLPDVGNEEKEMEVETQENGDIHCRFTSRMQLNSESERCIGERYGGSKPTDSNVRRMHTAVTMNKKIKENSSEAQLVILNLPKPPKSFREQSEMNYMEFVEVLTDGLTRVLMVRGAGREVVTIYS